MPPTLTDEGRQIAARLRKSHPQVGVVLLSQFDAPVYARALLEEGSAGRAYLLKERVSDPEQLIGAVREVARGGSVIDPKLVETLVAALVSLAAVKAHINHIVSKLDAGSRVQVVARARALGLLPN